MTLRLDSRPVGEVLIIQCQGRIVAGKEVSALHSYVGDTFRKYGDVVLQLDQVEFVDSSGLGALVRLTQAVRAKGGDLKLSGTPANIRKVLEMWLAKFSSNTNRETAGSISSRRKRSRCIPKRIESAATLLRWMLSMSIAIVNI